MPAGVAQGVGEQDGLGAGADGLFELADIDVIGPQLDVDEDRDGTVLQDGIDGGREAGGGVEDLAGGGDGGLAREEIGRFEMVVGVMADAVCRRLAQQFIAFGGIEPRDLATLALMHGDDLVDAGNAVEFEPALGKIGLTDRNRVWCAAVGVDLGREVGDL